MSVDRPERESVRTTPFTEALSQLNDRALRRLLGARAFLRGYDYVRRQAVTDVLMEDLSARGSVRGTEPEPYAVKLQAPGHARRLHERMLVPGIPEDQRPLQARGRAAHRAS